MLDVPNMPKSLDEILRPVYPYCVEAGGERFMQISYILDWPRRRRKDADTITKKGPDCRRLDWIGLDPPSGPLVVVHFLGADPCQQKQFEW